MCQADNAIGTLLKPACVRQILICYARDRVTWRCRPTTSDFSCFIRRLVNTLPVVNAVTRKKRLIESFVNDSPMEREFDPNRSCARVIIIKETQLETLRDGKKIIQVDYKRAKTSRVELREGRRNKRVQLRGKGRGIDKKQPLPWLSPGTSRKS